MNVRKNRGLERSRSSSFGSMLMMEGARENILPANPFSSRYCTTEVTGADFLGATRDIMFPEFPVWAFSIKKDLALFRIKIKTECPREHLGYAFSMFARTSAPCNLLLKCALTDGDERKCDHLVIQDHLIRFEVAHEFARAHTSLSLELYDLIPEAPVLSDDEPMQIFLALLSLEEGLFASSVIPPGEPRGFRDAETLFYPREGSFFEGSAGTISFFFAPDWTGPQLGSDTVAYLIDCGTQGQLNAISVVADGADYGKIKVIIVTEGSHVVLDSEIIPVRGNIYAIALRWTKHSAELLVNGRLVAAADGIDMSNKDRLSEHVYIASTGRSGRLSAFGRISHVLATNWLSDLEIRAWLVEKYPALFVQFEADWLRCQYPKPQLITPDSWAFDLIQKMLRLQRAWQSAPPDWLLEERIDESKYRDEMYRLLQAFDLDVIREEHSAAGRTDLLVRECSDTRKQVRMEFKIWGRHDFDQVPAKPLKYFLDGECIGIVVMINPRKRNAINSEYRVNVSRSPTDLALIIDRPFETSGFPDHFVSAHNSETQFAEVLHIVLNRYGPFPVDGSAAE
jgi:hypothetical protein